MAEPKIVIVVSPEEHATIIAALRHYQAHLPSIDDGIADIATDGGTREALTEEQIDDLCERIN